LEKKYFAKLERGLFKLWVFVDTKDSNTKKYFYYSQPKISCTTKTHENGLKRQFPSVISVMMIFYRKMLF